MGRNTMRSGVNSAMRQRLFTEYLNEQNNNNMRTYYTVQCDDTNKPEGIETDKYFELKEGNLVYEYAKICQLHNLDYNIYIEHFDEFTDTIEQMINVNDEFKIN